MSNPIEYGVPNIPDEKSVLDRSPGLLPVESYMLEVAPQESPTITTSRFRNAMHIARRSIQATVIVAEVGPLNELARYSAFGIAQTLSGDALVGAAVYGGSTLIIEGTAALATADIFGSDISSKAFGWINKKLIRFVPEEAKMTKTVEAGVALLGGSVVVMAAKQREEPERTKEQNRKYGLFTASWLAGVCAVQGAVMAEGISHPEPKTIGAALIAVGGVMAAAKWAKNRLTNREKNSTAS